MSQPISRKPPEGEAIAIPQTQALRSLLVQLDIEIDIQTTKKGGEIAYVTEAACDKAGISYEFFKAFASIDKIRKNSFEYPSHYLFGTEQRLRKLQERKDQTLSMDEANLLVSVLNVLGKENFDATTMDPLRDFYVRKPEELKLKVNILGAEPCWLGKEALRVGLLGETNGAKTHYVTFKPSPLGEDMETTRAVDFSCPYIESLNEYTAGLALTPNNLPEPVQKSTESTVILEFNNGDSLGCGFVVLENGYLLINKHFMVGDRNESGLKKVDVKIREGSRFVKTTAEVIDIEGFEFDPHPDLCLLYVGDLLDHLRPLTFSDNLELGWIRPLFRKVIPQVSSFSLINPELPPPKACSSLF